MDMIEIPRSSCIREAGYDEKTQTMIINFKSGGRYEFKRVPKDIFDQMIKAPSVGKFFHAHIEKNYQYHKIF